MARFLYKDYEDRKANFFIGKDHHRITDARSSRETLGKNPTTAREMAASRLLLLDGSVELSMSPAVCVTSHRTSTELPQDFHRISTELPRNFRRTCTELSTVALIYTRQNIPFFGTLPKYLAFLSPCFSQDLHHHISYLVNPNLNLCAAAASFPIIALTSPPNLTQTGTTTTLSIRACAGFSAMINSNRRLNGLTVGVKFTVLSLNAPAPKSQASTVYTG